MRITNEQKSATVVTINQTVSMSRDIIANSNITKAYIVNPCNTDVNTPNSAIHVHVYRDYLNLYVHSTYTYIVASVI